MERTETGDGLVILSSPDGVIDTRNGQIYSEVVCKIRYERFFAEAE